jgi:hypothetical protein
MRDEDKRGSVRDVNEADTNRQRSARPTKKSTMESADESAEARRESGDPGGGQGRRDEVGPTGVYPMSAGIPEGKHLEIRTPASWGQGDRGAAGYEDAGGSELTWRDGQLLGGTTAGPSGEPTIDIHGGDRPQADDRKDVAHDESYRKNNGDRKNGDDNKKRR